MKRMDLDWPEIQWQPPPCCIEASYNHDGAYYSDPRSACTASLSNLSGTSGRWPGPPTGLERTHRRCCTPPPTAEKACPVKGLTTDLSRPEKEVEHLLPNLQGLEGSRPCGLTLDVVALPVPEEDCGRILEHELRLHKWCSWILSEGNLGCPLPRLSGWILLHCQKWTQSQNCHIWNNFDEIKTTNNFCSERKQIFTSQIFSGQSPVFRHLGSFPTPFLKI